MCFGIKRWPFLDICTSLRTYKRLLCLLWGKWPLFFTWKNIQVMSINPQINIKVSIQLEGLGKSIWKLSMTSIFSLRTKTHGEVSVFVALIGHPSLFISYCSTSVTKTRQRRNKFMIFSGVWDRSRWLRLHDCYVFVLCLFSRWEQQISVNGPSWWNCLTCYVRSGESAIQNHS